MSAPPSSSAGFSPVVPSEKLVRLVGFLDPVSDVVGEERDGASASSAEGSGDESAGGSASLAEGSGGSASSSQGSGDKSADGSASSTEGSGDDSDGGTASSSEGSGDESDRGSTRSSGGSDDESDGFSLEEGRGNFIVRFHRRSAVREQSSGEEEAEDFLCLLICDLLAVLPRASNQCWDEGICRRVSAGLNSCDGHEKSSQKNLSDSRGSDIVDVSEINDTEHSVTIDVRGQYIDDAKEELMTHLVRCSSVSDLRYLKAIVGCKVHGVGKGKLMQALIDLLELDDTIEWKKENEGSVISIKLEGGKDYSSLGWDENRKIQPSERGQGIEKEKAMCQVVTDAQDKDFLCTFVCDFLFGIPKVANTCWDNNMCKRVATGKCDRAEFERQKPYYDRGNAVTFDIRGQYVVDALNIFKSRLYSCSCISSPISSMKYVDVIVGCKVHGIGEGKLKQAIVDVLEKEDDLKWKEEYGGAVLHIKLDGRRYFNFLGEDFVPPVYDFGMDTSDSDDHASDDDSKDYSGSD